MPLEQPLAVAILAILVFRIINCVILHKKVTILPRMMGLLKSSSEGKMKPYVRPLSVVKIYKSKTVFLQPVDARRRVI